MPKLLIPLVGMAMASAAVLLVPRAEATGLAGIQAVPGATSAVEQAAQTCVRRRVCRPGAACAWRTVCKRTPSKMGPATTAPGTKSPGTTGPGKM